MKSLCRIEGCSGVVTGQRLCSKHYQRLKHHGDPLAPVRARRAKWTAEDLLHLEELIEQGLSDLAIGKRLGCTAIAVQVARKRNKIAPRQRALLSARAVAERLGVACSKTVTRWIERGFLKARKGQRAGPNRMWYVSEDGLQRFLEDRSTWALWDPTRITDLAWREWAMDMRRGVRLLTTGQVGRRLGFTDRAVSSWIRQGVLPAQRRGNWLISEVDLDGFVPPCEVPRKGQARRPFTIAEDTVIRQRMAERKPVAAIARELKRSISPVYRRVQYLGLPLHGRAA